LIGAIDIGARVAIYDLIEMNCQILNYDIDLIIMSSHQ